MTERKAPNRPADGDSAGLVSPELEPDSLKETLDELYRQGQSEMDPILAELQGEALREDW